MRSTAIPLAFLVMVGVAVAEDKPQYTLVPDWSPQVGGVGNLVNPKGEGVLVAFSPAAWTKLKDAVKANDQVGIRQMIEGGEAALVPNATSILLLKQYEKYRPNRYADYIATSWEARLQGSEYKDKKMIVGAGFVCKLVGGESQTAAKSSKTFKADREANKASNAFRAARKLESEGNTSAAVNSYKRVARDFPDSPEARMADARVKALTK